MRNFVTAMICCSLFTGCSFLSNLELPDTDNGGDTAKPTLKYTDQQHWDALATLVENGDVRHTDEIVWVADLLKKNGYLKDVSRVDSYRPKRETLDNGNRNFIANALRGGN